MPLFCGIALLSIVAVLCNIFTDIRRYVKVKPPSGGFFVVRFGGKMTADVGTGAAVMADNYER
ncbi:hypothetical protein KGQ24_01420 [Patescibacteria group bacterium]|nr:hypothetical protein [Patescibacteria group bacterium]